MGGLAVGFDDVELGGAGGERVPLRSATTRELSHTAPQAQHGGLGVPSPRHSPQAAAPGADFAVSAGSQWLEFNMPQGTASSNPGEAVKVGNGPGVSTSGLSFNMVASSVGAAPSVEASAHPGSVSGHAGMILEPAERQHSTLAAACDIDAHQMDMPQAQYQRGSAVARFPQQLGHYIKQPVNVPMGSVLFSIICAILALTFFVLFIANHEAWEDTGCTLLLTASSATAAHSSLMLHGVERTTLVCLGEEEHGPLVAEDSLAALLVTHPDAFKDAHAQLSFTPVGGTGRWGISLEIKMLMVDAANSTATIQVDDWETAAAADASTIYPGTEAFEEKFGSGTLLSQPLLVIKAVEEKSPGLLMMNGSD